MANVTPSTPALPDVPCLPWCPDCQALGLIEEMAASADKQAKAESEAAARHWRGRADGLRAAVRVFKSIVPHTHQAVGHA